MTRSGLVKFHICASRFEMRSQPRRMIGWHNWIRRTIGEENPTARQRAGASGFVQHDHGAKKHATGEELRVELEEDRAHVGAIGKSDHLELARIEPVLASGERNELRQCRRAGPDIVQIEDPFGKSAKESRGSVFEHGAAWTQQRGSGGKLVSEVQQIVLIATGSMQKEQRRRAGITGFLENVMMGKSHRTKTT